MNKKLKNKPKDRDVNKKLKEKKETPEDKDTNKSKGYNVIYKDKDWIGVKESEELVVKVGMVDMVEELADMVEGLADMVEGLADMVEEEQVDMAEELEVKVVVEAEMVVQEETDKVEMTVVIKNKYNHEEDHDNKIKLKQEYILMED